jgi:hypothetical protein
MEMRMMCRVCNKVLRARARRKIHAEVQWEWECSARAQSATAVATYSLTNIGSCGTTVKLGGFQCRPVLSFLPSIKTLRFRFLNNSKCFPATPCPVL